MIKYKIIPNQKVIIDKILYQKSHLYSFKFIWNKTICQYYLNFSISIL